MKMILAMIVLFLVAKSYADTSLTQVDCFVSRPGYQKYEVYFQFFPTDAHAYIQFEGRNARGVFYAYYVDVTTYDSHRYATLFANDNKKMTFELPEAMFRLENARKEFQVSINHGEFFAICSGK